MGLSRIKYKLFLFNPLLKRYVLSTSRISALAPHFNPEINEC